VRARRSWSAAAVLLTVAMAGCSGGESQARSTSRTITVFAASSLSGTFTELGRQFEQTHPGTTARFSFGASSTLAQQIVQGAPAQVFAAASLTTMDTVSKAGEAAGEPAVFARNRLQIAVPKGNPAKVRGLADFGDGSLRIALCAARVPCGAAAVKALAAAGITAKPDTLEQDAKTTLAKVRLAEVDAALVYRTDVIAATGDVEGIDFPEAAKAVNDCPIVVTTAGRDSAVAAEFVALVRSPAGQAVLRRAGFELP
jgi:molybdate transport system substrate-binding protein